jgi:hypothetical protein
MTTTIRAGAIRNAQKYNQNTPQFGRSSFGNQNRHSTEEAELLRGNNKGTGTIVIGQKDALDEKLNIEDGRVTKAYFNRLLAAEAQHFVFCLVGMGLTAI